MSKRILLILLVGIISACALEMNMLEVPKKEQRKL